MADKPNGAAQAQDSKAQVSAEDLEALRQTIANQSKTITEAHKAVGDERQGRVTAVEQQIAAQKLAATNGLAAAEAEAQKAEGDYAKARELGWIV